MLLIISEHAKDKMEAFNFSPNDIKIAIKRGSITKQTNGFLACYTYYGVAYKILWDKAYKVKTVFIL